MALFLATGSSWFVVEIMSYLHQSRDLACLHPKMTRWINIRKFESVIRRYSITELQNMPWCDWMPNYILYTCINSRGFKSLLL